MGTLRVNARLLSEQTRVSAFFQIALILVGLYAVLLVGCVFIDWTITKIGL